MPYKKELRSTYNSYTCMKSRCYDKRRDNYKYYGGKGITVCERWLNSFQSFIKDMGLRPENMTLDRIDGNQNYEPSNCKWSTPKEQTANRKMKEYLYCSCGEKLTETTTHKRRRKICIPCRRLTARKYYYKKKHKLMEEQFT